MIEGGMSGRAEYGLDALVDTRRLFCFSRSLAPACVPRSVSGARREGAQNTVRTRLSPRPGPIVIVRCADLTGSNCRFVCERKPDRPRRDAVEVIKMKGSVQPRRHDRLDPTAHRPPPDVNGASGSAPQLAVRDHTSTLIRTAVWRATPWAGVPYRRSGWRPGAFIWSPVWGRLTGCRLLAS